MNKPAQNPAPEGTEKGMRQRLKLFPCLLLANPCGRYSCLIHNDILPQYGGVVKDFLWNRKAFPAF